MKRLLPFIIFFLILVMGVALIPLLLRPESHRTEITEALAKLTQKRVLLGTMHMTYFPPTLAIEQIAVMKDADNPILQIGSATAVLDWKALFGLKLVPKRVRLLNWVLTLRRRADGQWDSQDWVLGLSGGSSAAGPLEEVRWIEGEVRWVDEFAGAPSELALSAVQGHWDPQHDLLETAGSFQTVAATRVNLTAKGKFFHSPQWAGDLRLTSQTNQTAGFHLVAASDVLEVRGEASRWPLANALPFLRFISRSSLGSDTGASSWALENWRFHWRQASLETVVEHQADLGGGQSEFRAILKPQSTGLLVRVNGVVKNVPAPAILSSLGVNLSLAGSVTGVAKNVEMVGSSRSGSTLNGEGSLDLDSGLYRVPESSFGKLHKARLMKYVQKKYPDLVTKGLVITRLHIAGQAKNGMIFVDDVSLVSNDLRAAFAGKLDVARRGLDGFVRLQIREKDPKKLSLIPVKYRTAPAFGRLQGTWQDWILRSVSSNRIPSAAQSKLRKALQQK
jgi:hypothetical protein